MWAATEASKRLYKLIDQVQESHEPVQITGKRGSAMLIGEDDGRAVQETLHPLPIPGMRESILEGMIAPRRQCALQQRRTRAHRRPYESRRSVTKEGILRRVATPTAR